MHQSKGSLHFPTMRRQFLYLSNICIFICMCMCICICEKQNRKCTKAGVACTFPRWGGTFCICKIFIFVFVFVFVRSQIGSAPEQGQLALSHNEAALFDLNACSTYHPINPSVDQPLWWKWDKMLIKCQLLLVNVLKYQNYLILKALSIKAVCRYVSWVWIPKYLKGRLGLSVS